MAHHKRKRNKQKNPKKQERWLESFWNSRASLLVLLVVFVFVSISVLKEGVLRVERQQEIVELESEIARLESRNTRIRDAITVLNSSSKQDKLSRTKLGVQQPGEKVVFFPGDQIQPELVLETPDADTVEATILEKTNPEKWAEYFMGQYNE